MSKQKQIGAGMKTRNLTHRFGSPAGMPMLGLVLAMAGVAPAQQAGPQAPPEPPWVTSAHPSPTAAASRDGSSAAGVDGARTAASGGTRPHTHWPHEPKPAVGIGYRPAG
jgi:hypothetical protein